MRYLIDGYNLMYALGLVRRDGGRAGWDRARRQMLDWLADRTGAAASEVSVVLDAQMAIPGPLIKESHRGLWVIRLPGNTADALIEGLLKEEPSPATLTVVSNDGRVRDAAKQCGCPLLQCMEYIDRLVSRREPVHLPAQNEKDIRATEKEKAEWLKAFGK